MSVPEASAHPMTEIRGIPRTVVALGLVSLFMDMSSESKAGAERFLRRVRPDLVVLDCLLVGGDGLQLAKQLGSEANVPVVVTSGDIEKAEQAVEVGLLCFQKPFRLSELVAAVSNLLAGSEVAESSNPYRLSGHQRD